MTIIIPPNDFVRDPGAEQLLSMFRLLTEEIFSPKGEIYEQLGFLSTGEEFRERIISPILHPNFAKAFENARMIADNCAVLDAAGGLPPGGVLAESGELPEFFQKTLAKALLNCYEGVMGLNGIARDMLELTKSRSAFKDAEANLNLDELCSKVSDGYTLGVTINRQIDPVLSGLIRRTFNIAPPPAWN